jgi:hypothetical protein
MPGDDRLVTRCTNESATKLTQSIVIFILARCQEASDEAHHVIIALSSSEVEVGEVGASRGGSRVASDIH